MEVIRGLNTTLQELTTLSKDELGESLIFNSGGGLGWLSTQLQRSLCVEGSALLYNESSGLLKFRFPQL